MAFMEPQIEQGAWYDIDGDNGTTFLPFDVVGDLDIPDGQTVDQDDDRWEDIVKALRDYYDGQDIWEVKVVSGYGARLSAPGYLDCTPWSVFETEAEAQAYLEEETADDDGEGPTSDDVDAMDDEQESA